MKNSIRVLLAALAVAAASTASAAEVYGSLNAPGVYFGSGNPNGAFNIDRANGLELGLRAKNRGAGPVLIDGSSGTYSVDQGLCNPVCGGGPKAAWNYEWSVHTSGAALTDYIFRLGVDKDPTGGTNFTFVNPLTYWTDNAMDGTAGAQNSQNVRFGDTPGGAFDVYAAGTYEFVLQAFAANETDFSATNALANVDMTVQVPEPGSSLLIGLGLASLAVLRRRQAKR